MRVALGTADLRPFHAERPIRFFDNRLRIDRFGKTWPPGSGIEFFFRGEKRLTGDNVDIDSGLMIVPVSVSKRRLSSVFFSDVVLLGTQTLLQLGIGNFRHIISSIGCGLTEGSSGANKARDRYRQDETVPHISLRVI
jgi:hypothetical protein